jgi:hypothetical protein
VGTFVVAVYSVVYSLNDDNISPEILKKAFRKIFWDSEKSTARNLAMLPLKATQVVLAPVALAPFVPAAILAGAFFVEEVISGPTPPVVLGSTDRERHSRGAGDRGFSPSDHTDPRNYRHPIGANTLYRGRRGAGARGLSTSNHSDPMDSDDWHWTTFYPGRDPAATGGGAYAATE